MKCSVSTSSESAAPATRGPTFASRSRDGLLAVVQCKYHKQGLVGSPELQKFLGTIHHTRSQKGFFVTTSTFTLSAEKFAAENPIELLDGPRLVELVHHAMGPNQNARPSLSYSRPITDDRHSKCSFELFFQR